MAISVRLSVVEASKDLDPGEYLQMAGESTKACDKVIDKDKGRKETTE